MKFNANGTIIEIKSQIMVNLSPLVCNWMNANKFNDNPQKYFDLPFDPFEAYIFKYYVENNVLVDYNKIKNIIEYLEIDKKKLHNKSKL